MDIKFVKEIMKEFQACELTKLELKYDDVEIKLEKKTETIIAQPMAAAMAPNHAPVACAPAPAVFGGTTEHKMVQMDGYEVKSPMVGTVYTASSPDAPPFVKVGQKVRKGDVICIIEAMKLMNEVESEVDGEVVEILAQNEAMVQFGETLVVIR